MNSTQGVGEHAREQMLAGVPVSERWLTLAGMSTALLEGGDGPPMVLLHGPGESAAAWLPVVPDLVRTHHVIVPDLPGHGATGMPDDQLDTDRVLCWLDELIERTCPSPPVLVGRVVGGGIGATWAADRPGRLSRLVLVDTLGLTPFEPAPRFGLALHRFLAQPTAATYDRFMEFCTFDLDRVREQMGQRWQPYAAYAVELAGTPGAQAAMAALIRQFGAVPIPVADLARIDVPVSLIWGRHDLATPLSIAEAVAARYDWPLYVIEDAGDDPPLEQPNAFLDALRAVLRTPIGEVGCAMTIEHETSPSETAAVEHGDHPPVEAWDAIAAGYAAHVAPGEQSLSAEALRLVGLTPGESFLDVAAGPGGLGLAAARLGATVLATDWSPAMVAQFESRARSEGLVNASAAVMDAHALDIQDDRFDVTGSQFGVMLVSDQALALREMVRVTKPGGRVVLVAYGSPAEFDALQFFVAALRSVAPDFEGLPDDPPPLEFQVSDPDILRERLVSAGLKDVQVDTTQQERLELSTGQEVWDWMVYSNPITKMILDEVGVKEADRAKMRSSLHMMIREREDVRGVAVLTASLNIGWGRKGEGP